MLQTHSLGYMVHFKKVVFPPRMDLSPRHFAILKLRTG